MITSTEQMATLDVTGWPTTALKTLQLTLVGMDVELGDKSPAWIMQARIILSDLILQRDRAEVIACFQKRKETSFTSG